MLESVREYEGMNPHTPKATPTLGDGVPVDSRNFRRRLQGSKPNGLWRSLYNWKALETLMSKMSSRCSFGHLKHKLWPKEGPGVKLTVWLPTTKSQESTQFTWLQGMCHISLENSRQKLQLCSWPHRNPRSDRNFMGLQSRKSPIWGDRKAIWMWASWPTIEYTIRGRWWLPPSSARDESCVSVLLVARPSTKGASTMH